MGLEGQTYQAIELYTKIERMNRKLEELEAELNLMVMTIPKNEMDDYITATEKIGKDNDLKKYFGHQSYKTPHQDKLEKVNSTIKK